MITQENLKKQYNLIKVSFGLKFASKNEEEAYLTILFKVLSKHSLTDKNITEGAEKLILNMTKKDFAEMFGFGAIPAPADFVKFFGGSAKKELTTEEIAKLEVEKILYEARYAFSSWKPENPTTIAVIASFPRGLKTIHFELFDSWNPSKKNQSFFKKELLEKWLNFHEMRKVSNENLRLDCEVAKALPNLKVNR